MFNSPKIVLSIIIAAWPSMAVAENYLVDSAAGLRLQLQGAQSGDTVTVKDGIYTDFDVQLESPLEGTGSIIITPQSHLGVIFTGNSSIVISGYGIIFQSFQFENYSTPAITLLNAVNSRISGCQFVRGTATAITLRSNSINNRIDNSTFTALEARGIQLIVRGESSPKNNRIDHNLFRDIPPAPRKNGREVIQLGQDHARWGDIGLNTQIDHNYFYRCNGESEIISNKSSNNQYLNNLFVECDGELMIRGGNDCTIRGNRFEYCASGIALTGLRHQVLDNVIFKSKKSGIRIIYGTDSGPKSFYRAFGESIIAYNTIIESTDYGIILGADKGYDVARDGRPWNAARYGSSHILQIAPYRNIIVGNIITGSSGTLFVNNSDSINTIGSNLIYAEGNASIGSPGEGSILKAPRFVGGATNYYHLAADSPARGIVIDEIVQNREHIGAAMDSLIVGPQILGR